MITRKTKKKRTPPVDKPIVDVTGTTSQNEPYLYPDLYSPHHLSLFLCYPMTNQFVFDIESKLPILHTLDNSMKWDIILFLYKLLLYLHFIQDSFCFKCFQTNVTDRTKNKLMVTIKQTKKIIIISIKNLALITPALSQF